MEGYVNAHQVAPGLGVVERIQHVDAAYPDDVGIRRLLMVILQVDTR